MPRKILLLSFFVLGITSILCQVVLFREMMISFQGNEFFTSLLLAFWLFWTGLGSYFLAKIFRASPVRSSVIQTVKAGVFNKSKKMKTSNGASPVQQPRSRTNSLRGRQVVCGTRHNFKILVLCLFLIPFFLLAGIILLRFLGAQTQFPGEIPNLIYSLILALFIPAPLCLILGLQFTITAQIFIENKTSKNDSKAKMLSSGYFLETIGFIIGGILFSFFLIKVDVFQTAGLIAFLNFGICFLILNGSALKNYLPKLINLILVLVFILISFPAFSRRINYLTNSLRFKRQILLKSINSYYGNIAITKFGEQYNFYESGLILGSNQASEFPEELIHLSLLQHKKPEKILLIGNGFDGSIKEILKHPVTQVYYLELDPRLIETIQEYLAPEIKQALYNQKVKIISADACYFLATTKEQFDAIIINLPDPSTALLNRFYTQEFFQKAKRKLKPDGILATYLTFSSVAAGKNLENLNASLYKTLKSVFLYVMSIPGDTNFFLASNDDTLTYNSEILIQGLKQRQIKTRFVNEGFIKYQLSNERIEKTLNLFEKNQEAQKNTDSKPIAYFYYTLFWLERFYFNLSNIVKKIASSFDKILAVILIFLTIFILKEKRDFQKISPIFSMGLAGFSLITQELIIIFTYQQLIGYLYFRIALIIALIMAGLALGTFLGQRIRRCDLRKLRKLHLVLILFLLFLMSGLKILCQSSLGQTGKEIILIIAACLIGIIPGMIFPLANKIYFQETKESKNIRTRPSGSCSLFISEFFKFRNNKKIGVIYSADLIGSCFGALVCGLILVPVFGIFETLFFITVINFWFVLIFLLTKT